MFCLFAATRPRLIRIVIFCLRHHIGFLQQKRCPSLQHITRLKTDHFSRPQLDYVICGNYNRLSFNLLRMNWRYHFTEIIYRFSLETVRFKMFLFKCIVDFKEPNTRNHSCLCVRKKKHQPIFHSWCLQDETCSWHAKIKIKPQKLLQSRLVFSAVSYCVKSIIKESANADRCIMPIARLLFECLKWARVFFPKLNFKMKKKGTFRVDFNKSWVTQKRFVFSRAWFWCLFMHNFFEHMVFFLLLLFGVCAC